jgi:hypothetical protein
MEQAPIDSGENNESGRRGYPEEETVIAKRQRPTTPPAPLGLKDSSAIASASVPPPGVAWPPLYTGIVPVCG